MDLDRAIRRGIEKNDQLQQGMTAEEIENYTDERTDYRNEYDRELERLIVVDALTGLPNDKGVKDELGKALESMHQPLVPEKKRLHEQPALEEFALLYIDLDNFKRVNDTLGHDEGNRVLKKTAGILEGSVREGEVVARLHGDEFIVFLPRTSEEGARTAAEKILENLRNEPELQKLGIGASIGVRHIDKSSLTEEVTAETLIKEADLQQAKAKQAGKGKVVMYQNNESLPATVE